MSPIRGYFRLTLTIAAWFAASVAAYADGRNYLIVAAEDFAGSTHLSRLADAREARGFDVTLYSVPVGTSKEAIKAQIESWYLPSGDSYILIVGDSDSDSAPSTGTTIPHWSGSATMSPPTDLPYACTGAGDDWYPEILLGRFAIDTEAELESIVDKTLLIEAGAFPDPEYSRQIAMLATSDTSAEAEQTHEAVIAQYLDPAGFTSTRIYAAQGGDTPEIMAAINAGTLFTVYFGHSSHSGWWEPSFRNENVLALSNQGLYGVALAFSCCPAGFNHFYGECLGETWIRETNKGGAAFIGSTMLLPMGSDDMWEACRRLEDWFFSTIFEDGIWCIGPAWHAARNELWLDPEYGPSHPDTRNYFEMFVILGDPALLLPHKSGVAGDGDNDGDIDLADFVAFQTCHTGPAGGPVGPSCETFDFNADDDVDSSDFDEFSDAMLGPE